MNTKNFELLNAIENDLVEFMNSDVMYDTTGLFVVQELHAIADGVSAYESLTEVDIINALRNAGKRLDCVLPDEDRVAIVESIEAKYEGKLSRKSKRILSDFILYNYLEGDTDTYKMQNTEYPILSDTQRARRIGKSGVRGNYEVSSIWLENVPASVKA